MNIMHKATVSGCHLQCTATCASGSKCPCMCRQSRDCGALLYSPVIGMCIWNSETVLCDPLNFVWNKYSNPQQLPLPHQVTCLVCQTESRKLDPILGKQSPAAATYCHVGSCHILSCGATGEGLVMNDAAPEYLFFQGFNIAWTRREHATSIHIDIETHNTLGILLLALHHPFVLEGTVRTLAGEETGSVKCQFVSSYSDVSLDIPEKFVSRKKGDKTASSFHLAGTPYCRYQLQYWLWLFVCCFLIN